MAKAKALSRGIQIVQWKNADKTKQVRFRVRINREDFKCDKYFDDQQDAEDFLAETKSKAGRQEIERKKSSEEEKIAEKMAYLKNPPIKHYLDKYFKDYVEKKTDNPTKLSSQSTHLARLEAMKKVELTYEGPFTKSMGVARISGVFKAQKKALGEMRLEDVNAATATEYIRERLKTCKPSTVLREVGMLQTIYNKVQYMDPAAWQRIKDENPWEASDKSLLKGARSKRKRRLSDAEEDALFEQLKACRNPEMLQIAALAMATGLRRGEVIPLRWVQIKDGYIDLDATDTKSEEGRTVPLTAEAKGIIDALPKKDDRLFHYTGSGYAAVWRRVKERAGIENYRFHDLRREFISRALEVISSPIAVAQAAGIQDIGHFNRQYFTPFKEMRVLKHGVKTEEDLMRTVGHADLAMTAHYASLNK